MFFSFSFANSSPRLKRFDVHFLGRLVLPNTIFTHSWLDTLTIVFLDPAPCVEFDRKLQTGFGQ